MSFSVCVFHNEMSFSVCPYITEKVSMSFKDVGHKHFFFNQNRWPVFFCIWKGNETVYSYTHYCGLCSAEHGLVLADSELWP